MAATNTSVSNEQVAKLECFMGSRYGKDSFSIHCISEDNRQQITQLILKFPQGGDILPFFLKRTAMKIQEYVDSNSLAPLYFVKWRDCIPFIFSVDRGDWSYTFEGKVLDPRLENFSVVKATMEWFIRDFLPTLLPNEKKEWGCLYLPQGLHPYFLSYLDRKEIPYETDYNNHVYEIKMHDLTKKEPLEQPKTPKKPKKRQRTNWR